MIKLEIEDHSQILKHQIWLILWFLSHVQTRYWSGFWLFFPDSNFPDLEVLKVFFLNSVSNQRIFIGQLTFCGSFWPIKFLRPKYELREFLYNLGPSLEKNWIFRQVISLSLYDISCTLKFLWWIVSKHLL